MAHRSATLPAFPVACQLGIGRPPHPGARLRDAFAHALHAPPVGSFAVFRCAFAAFVPPTAERPPPQGLRLPHLGRDCAPTASRCRWGAFLFRPRLLLWTVLWACSPLDATRLVAAAVALLPLLCGGHRSLLGALAFPGCLHSALP